MSFSYSSECGDGEGHGGGWSEAAARREIGASSSLLGVHLLIA